MKAWDLRMRTARIIHLAFLLSVPILAVVGEFAGGLADPGEVESFAVIRLVFFVACATAALIGFQFRARMIPVAMDALRRSRGDSDASQRWLSGHIIPYALAETVAVCGFALRFLGGTLYESLPFYAIALGLLLAWMPRRAWSK
ncbi:MAG: hypothetical protein ACRD5F_13805 [Candidatus Acidiferrales bacterium]